ncbi:carbohydrate ABC transporter permease [Paenibacillus glycanilyticus]|uniref:carbohydrate ABC transporter permease n=1 Tax=Paenibacillus glycanilyticus TaxID=126569 RepID=UPI00203D22B2|nr:carbohydrate ABC transporter permease [Paenibacillus glycanilyticus]MCM3626729.1 carbohydrate ABC transporter permease [Paenibacillus glycanilyticus]
MKQISAIRESKQDRIFLFCVYAGLSLVLVMVLYPLIYIVSSSFSSAAAVQSGKVWLWPVDPTLDGYIGVFKYNAVWTGFANSIFYTVGGTVLSVALTIMMAYPLSRKEMAGRKIWIWAILFAMLFNGGLIPFYLVVKDLGMLDSPLALIVPTALNVFSIIIAKTFFQTSLPNEIYEAAQLDGCGDFKFMISIAIPLSRPILAVLVLWAAVGQWNSYFNALIFLNSQSLYPLQLVLRQILVENKIDYSGMSATLDAQKLALMQNMETLLKYSLIVITTIPILVIYPFVQKHFVKGVMIGSVKE